MQQEGQTSSSPIPAATAADAQPSDELFVAAVGPDGQRDFILGWLAAIKRASGRPVRTVEIFLDGREVTTEDAIFMLSAEKTEPDLLLLVEGDSARYDAKHFSRRCRYHFPTARLGLLIGAETALGPELCRGYPVFHFYAGVGGEADALAAVADPAMPAATSRLLINEKTWQEKRDHGMAGSRVGDSIWDRPADLANYVPNTPNVPRALPTEDTVAVILARPRRRAKIMIVTPSQALVFGMGLNPAYPSLGAMMIAAMLEKAGHEVVICEQDADQMSDEAIAQAYRDGGYEIMGLTGTTPTYPGGVRIAKAARALCPDAKIILGGIHATVDPIACARETAFDFVVVGEGECTAVELVDAILDQRADFSAIKGLAYRGPDGKVVTTPQRLLAPDLDDYPPPARHLIRNPENYAPADAEHKRVATMMISRGCPGQCTYCQTKNIFGRRVRFRSPAKVLEEMRDLYHRFGIREIHILDDVLTADKKFVAEFFPMLINEPYKLTLRVPNGLRADMVSTENLSLLRDAGMRTVCFGIESGNDRVIKNIKKGISKDRVRKAVQTAKDVGLETNGFFIIGLPGDDEASIMDTINFAIELDVKYAKFLILKPFPGSEVFYQLDELGLVDSWDFAQYGTYTAPVHHLETLSQERILELQRLAFRKFYFRPSKIWEHLKGINSWERLRTAIRGGMFVLSRLFLTERPTSS